MNKDTSSVIVDPVLCYVSSHRKVVSDEYLGSIISQYFANVCISDAYELLHRQTAPLLAAVNDHDENTLATSAVGTIEAILHIFHLCDRYRINLPEFAVTDLNKLPPPPLDSHLESSIIDKNEQSPGVQQSDASSISLEKSENAEKIGGDAMFTRQALVKIMKELRQLKTLVINLSMKNSTTAVGVNTVLDDGDEDQAVVTETKEENAVHDECPDSNDSDNAVDSPAMDAPRSVEDQHPPSRGSSVSISRTATSTPPKKRGSSRSSSSIEDAVAKIKAQRCGGTSTTLYHAYPNDSGEACPSKTPSPNTEEVHEPIPLLAGNRSPISTPVDRDTPQSKTENETVFPQTLAARNLAAAMVHPSLFLSSRVPSLDLAAATFMARMFPATTTGMIPGSLSPQGHCLPAFATAVQQSQQRPTMEPFFTPSTPASTMGLLLRQHEQRQKVISALSASESANSKLQQAESKVKKALKRPTADLDVSVVKKKQHQAKSEINESPAEIVSNEDNGNGKPYECSHANCHKRFANKFLLKKHEFIHSGLRPYQCPYCFKRFNRKDNLLRHKGTHESNEPDIAKGGRRRCRVFGVRGPAKSANSSPSDAVINSIGSPPMADSSKISRQHSSSSAPNETEANGSSTPNSASAPPLPPSQAAASAMLQHPASIPAEFSLAALASYTALAHSHWPRAALSGIRSLND